MDSFAAMKRNPMPPDGMAQPAGKPGLGGGRRLSPSVSRSPILYLANLRQALGHSPRHDKTFGQK